jgi:diamine N-acetyltransferase
MPLSEFLTEFLFKPLEMNQVKYGYDSQVVSQTEIKETELVDMPMDYSVEGVFSVTFEDMGKLLKAIGSRKVISEKLWHQALKYDSNGTGLIFENANGFDCGNITFLGFGFFFYFNHKTGLAYGSLVTAQQKFKNINGDWHYYRRCLREVIEAAFTFPADTKLVKLDKKNMWQALTLKVEPDQEGFVLEAKSSVAMALMYKTKHAYVEMEGNRVVGLLVLEMDKRKNYYNIDIILIDRKYQGRGYGKIMLQWAVDKLTQEGAKELEIGVNRFNHAAKKIYLDIGFQPKAVYDGGMTLRMKL